MDTAKPFIELLESQKKDCLSKASGLAQDNRQDEADMQKIRANVFGIFTALSRTAKERFPGNQATFIQEQITKISQTWEESLLTAESHGDPVNTMKERIKLDAITEISELYARITEDMDDGR